MKAMLSAAALLAASLASHAQPTRPRPGGNPLFSGWYADPEAVIFNK